MEKKKLAKTLVLTAALAGGLTLAQSFTNEVQATGSSSFYCCLGWGTPCGGCINVPNQTQKW